MVASIMKNRTLRPGQRSLNLSNAVAVVVFQAWKQLGYAGGV